MSLPDWRRHDYNFDPDDGSGPSQTLRLVGTDKRVLDLGCGTGVIARALRQHNRCRVTGIERDPVMAGLAETVCERVIIADIDRNDLATLLPTQRFEVIVAADILEHLIDPWRCLRRLHSLLAPGGYLVTCVPNIGHSAVIAELLQGQFRYRDAGLLDRSHLRFFTAAGLTALLRESGFDSVEQRRYSVPAEQTEFADAWQQLTPALREALAAVDDASTYQFIVKARPQPGFIPEETANAPPEPTLTVAEQLAHYRQAFSEAHTLLDERERELAEYAKAFHEARALLERQQSQLEQLQPPTSRSHNLLRLLAGLRRRLLG